MAVLRIARLGHPVLRRAARALTTAQVGDPSLQRLIDDMVETMVASQGIGLAAPQVARSLRVVVFGEPGTRDRDGEGIPLTVLLNPRIVTRSEEQESGWEGCLSLPGLRGPVPRAVHVEVEALDRQGRFVRLEAEGYVARVVQHEIDHLDGVVFLDRMSDLRSLCFREEFEEFWAPARAEDAQTA